MTAKTYTQTDRQSDRQSDRQTDRTRPRNSSLELLRIIAMLVIITHHFGVHGIFHILDPAKSKL